MNVYFSAWTFIRVSGFLAYYLMTFSLLLGLCSSLSIMKKNKVKLISLHQVSGWYGLLTIFFHMVLIWQDQYVPYSLKEVLLPFYAENESIYSGLGTLSFFLFFLVIGSSDFFIKHLGKKKWKNLHFAVIPAWIMMFIHGIGIGTDSSEAWALVLYALGGSLLIVFGFVRYLEYVSLHKQKSNELLKQIK
ncbi:ferric reductase-like transmembrane domain-containing protein [Neobacillus niacini]|uniref:ferric reductase-like transmembrane domain-containing protein n=1 Tax=Neobacillus niacini TaxID=86668 RepID=UPI003000E2E5